jgi:hypothetical protein
VSFRRGAWRSIFAASVIEHKLGHRQEEPAGRCLINYISAEVLRRKVAERDYRMFAQGNE